MKGVSAYRGAIDQTATTITNRAKNFRNLVITVIALSFGSIVGGLLTWRLLPFTGLLLVVPVCGLFFLWDQKLLRDWRNYLIDSWVRKDVDFTSFCEAITSISTLPKETVRSMLVTIPNTKDLIAEQEMSSSTRDGVAAAVAGIHACQFDTLALKTTATAIVSGFVVFAVNSQNWKLLFGGFLIVLLTVLGKWLKRRRIKILKRKTFAARANVDFNREKYCQLVSSLHWSPISKADKDALLNYGNVARKS